MVYIVIMGILFALELLYFRIAHRFNIIDKPNLRSSHTIVTLRGGGVIFVLAVWIHAAFFGLAYPWFTIGLTLAALISLTDDVCSLPSRLRLLVQFVAMLLVLFQLQFLQQNHWWLFVVALIVCVGIVNAFNFMDGINGMTGGYSLVVLLSVLYLNGSLLFISRSFLYVIGLSLLVFCFFNFRIRARCFAGDVGSVSIAVILLFAVGNLIRDTGDFSYLVFFAVYGTDSILTICHRILLHENLVRAHRKHAYQLMANELCIPHVVVSLIYMGLQLVISFGMLCLPVNHYLYLFMVVFVLTIAYVWFMKRYYHLHQAYLNQEPPSK